MLGRFRREGSNPSANAIYWSVAQFGRAFGLGPRGRGFESCRSNHYRVLTQLVECCADIAVVTGSNPVHPTILLFILIDICDWMCYYLIILTAENHRLYVSDCFTT